MESNLVEGSGNGSTQRRKTLISTPTKEELERRCYPCCLASDSSLVQIYIFLVESQHVLSLAKLKGWKSGVRAYVGMVGVTQDRRRALRRLKDDLVWVFKEHGRGL